MNQIPLHSETAAHMQVQVHIFGSTATSLNLPTADIDIAIVKLRCNQWAASGNPLELGDPTEKPM